MRGWKRKRESETKEARKREQKTAGENERERARTNERERDKGRKKEKVQNQNGSLMSISFNSIMSSTSPVFLSTRYHGAETRCRKH